MRLLLGLLCGVVGMLAGWIGVAGAVIGLWGSGGDGGVAMSAFFQAGPLGGLVGFIAGALLSLKVGR